MKENIKKLLLYGFSIYKYSFHKNLLSSENQSLKKIDNFVKNEQQFQFSGLAKFYNNVSYYIVEKDNISKS